MENKKAQIKQRKTAQKCAFIFLVITLLWILTIFSGSRESETVFGFGVGLLGEKISDEVGGISNLLLDFMLSNILAVFFALVWQKTREQNLKVYRIGFIVYVFDTLLLLILFNSSYYGFRDNAWLGVVLHLIFVLILFKGYNALKKANI